MIPQMFGPDFHRSPDSAFNALRAIGPVAKAEISPRVTAWIVTGHDTAVDLLSDRSGTWTRNTRRWLDYSEGRVPADSPVLGILAWREGLLHTDGDAHHRLAEPLTSAMDRVPHHRLDAITRRVANSCLDQIVAAGRADLVTDFATRVPLLVFAELLACSRDASQRMVDACALIVSGGPAAAVGAERFVAELAEVVVQKQAAPGDDLASWMLAHPHRLDPREVTGNLFSLIGAGNVPTASWIVNSLHLLLTNDTYAGDLTSGSIAYRRAMQKSLWETAPVGTFTFLVATRDTHLHETKIPAGDLVLVSHHAANTDPTLKTLGFDSHAHLAWGGGEHRCPVPSHATVMTQAAITVVFDRAWDATITDIGPASPGFFHQCPTYFRVSFTPSTPTS